MTSENVAEYEVVASAADVSAKAVDDRLTDELVSRAQAGGLELAGEGAKHWPRLLTEIKNRGGSGRRADAGLRRLQKLARGSGDSWPKATVQPCVVHLPRNSFRHTARQDRDMTANWSGRWVGEQVVGDAPADVGDLRLVEAADEKQLTKTIARHGRVDLLAVDELGYMELDKRGAELLFQVLSEREEENSVAIACDEGFGGRTDSFRLAQTRLPRFVSAHRSSTLKEVINYRMTSAR